jgi:hypothetical protein
MVREGIKGRVKTSSSSALSKASAVPSLDQLLLLPLPNAFFTRYLTQMVAVALSTNALTSPLNAPFLFSRPLAAVKVKI